SWVEHVRHAREPAHLREQDHRGRALGLFDFVCVHWALVWLDRAAMLGSGREPEEEILHREARAARPPGRRRVGRPQGRRSATGGTNDPAGGIAIREMSSA